MSNEYDGHYGGHDDSYLRDEYGRVVLNRDEHGYDDIRDDFEQINVGGDHHHQSHYLEHQNHQISGTVKAGGGEEDVEDAFRRYEAEEAERLAAAPAAENAFHDAPLTPQNRIGGFEESHQAHHALGAHQEQQFYETPEEQISPEEQVPHLPTHEIIESIPEEAAETQSEKESKKLEELMALESNYPVPYRSKLTEPFEPGQTLIIKGKTAEDSVRFTISLHTATADFSGNDVPLHLSVRFDEGKIVFNTFSKGEWGKEERKSNPYKKGDDIDIRIRAHDNKYTIFADQKEIKEYEHRVPLSSVTHFSIDGDVFITHIHWGGKYYPVPYESGIPGEGLAPGKTLLIFGTPEKKGKRFHINLLKKNGDIAFHFNPRFDEKAIVRNSLISNEWGNEEREGKIHLEKGVGFDLKIVNEEYAFQVFINEERFCTYAHRLEPHDIHGLQIGGDVEITGIQIF